MNEFSHLDVEAWTGPLPEIARFQSPALVVYLDHVRRNLARVIDLTGGPDRWRPHVKTTKIPAVFAELVQAGLRSFKCATTREAEHLLATLASCDEADEGGDVLLAYPLIGPGLQRVGHLARAHENARVSVLCEDPSTVESIPDEVSIFVDVNPGMNRTGVPIQNASAVATDIARRAGERFRGVHYYDGHLHGEDPDERRAQAFRCYERLMDLLAELQRGGVHVGEVITSGTPSFTSALDFEPFTQLEDTLHRVSPGTVVYHDVRSERQNRDLGLVPAALVHARVVSHPTDGIVTCDAGSKSLAAESGEPCAEVFGHSQLRALEPNEEHLPLSVEIGSRPARGTSLLLVPFHVCPTVNLAEEAILIENGALRAIVPVSARAHELRAD